MLTVFESEGVEASWFVPGHSLGTFRENVEAVADAGRELGVHGYSHENPTNLSREQEAAILEKSIELIEDPDLPFLWRAVNSESVLESDKNHLHWPRTPSERSRFDGLETEERRRVRGR